MENKAKGNFISFFIGLLIGYWPLRWISAASTFAIGFALGNSFNFLTKLCNNFAQG